MRTCVLWLAAYVAYESISDLVSRKAPEHSIPGIILACVSLIVMPLLSRAKKQVANELGSSAMHADAKQTDFCVYLSAILLLGLVLKCGFGMVVGRSGCCPHHGPSYCEEFWFFSLGAVLWLIAFFGLSRPVLIYVFGHELTHALWVWFMGGRVSRSQWKKDHHKVM